VSETDKDISIVAELPRVSQQDVEVSLDDDVLTSHAQTRDQSTVESDGKTNPERHRKPRPPIEMSPVGSSMCETERHLGR